MSNPIQPPGPSPTDPNQQANSQNDEAAPLYNPFPGFLQTKDQVKQFLTNEFKFMSQIVKHDMQRMKEAQRKLRQASSEG